MRVFQINSTCGQGSTGKIAVDICKLLKSNEDECCIAYGRGKAPTDVNCYRVGSDFDVYLHAFLSRITDKQGLYSTDATHKLVDKIKEYKPDIIHLHNIHGYYLNYSILFAYLKACNIPVVWTFHDCWPFTGHCAYFDYVGCDRWKEGCFACPQKNSYPSSLMMDNSRANYNLKKEMFTNLSNLTIVTPSQWLAGLVEKSFLGKYSIEVINNGVDLDIFKPQNSDFRDKYNLNNKKIILGVASPWSKRKGLKDFLKLSKIVDPETVIVLVGLDSRVIKQMPCNIIGLTRTANQQELAEVYSAADIFFNPTYEDNYPTTNVEAIACGTPVITYSTGGSPEVIKNSGKFGVVLPQSSYEMLLKININKNNWNPAIRDLISKEIMGEKYFELYEKLMVR